MMTASAFVGILLTNAIPGFRRLARRSWCAKQRSRLQRLYSKHKVVWVHDGALMPWALWGADHQFFAVEWAGHLPYLRALSTAA
jgi:hypothetical protein